MRIISAADKAAKANGRAIPKRELQELLARQAAIEKALASYLPLVCGHYSTLDTHERYLAFRPKRGYTMCEQCEDWRKISKPPDRETPPQTPMF